MLRRCSSLQIVAVVVAVMSGLCGVSLCPAAEMALEELIEAVRQNELLYANIDVTITDRYEAAQMPDAAVEGSAVGHVGAFKVIQAESTRHRYVAQGDWYRLDSRGTLDFARDDQQTSLHLREYDGQSTRALSGGLGNIIHGRSDCDMPIRAHSLFMRMIGHMDSLSMYLTPRTVTRDGKVVGPALAEGEVCYDFVPEYKNQRVRNGERCYEVHCNRRVRTGRENNGRLLEQLVFWLSIERNLIPVELTAYDLEASASTPIMNAVVKSWLEVEAGVWFPKELEMRALDRSVLQSSGKQVPAWRRVYAVEAVSLKPDHPVSFFRSITFPEGTLVYEREDNTTIRGYRVGSPEDPNVSKRPPGGIHWRLLGGLLGLAAVLLTIVIVVAFRRRRKEHR